MKVIKILIGSIVLILFIFLASVNQSERNDEAYSNYITKTKKINLKTHKGHGFRKSIHFYQIHEKYFSLYSRLYTPKHLNSILFPDYILSPADFSISNKIDILWGTFNIYSLKYKIPLTKNIILWWQGHIPGLGGNENKFGLTYSNKFNFIILDQDKKTRPIKGH